MNQLAPVQQTNLQPLTTEQLDRAFKLEAEVLQLPQIDIETDHVLHAGMYSRTIKIPEQAVVTGSLMKINTILILNGDILVSAGDDTIRMTGHHVLTGLAGRKTSVLALKETFATMIFPTSARTVEEAEREFTDEADKLFSRQGRNNIRITGE